MKEMMKAAVVINGNTAPLYTDMPLPVARNEGELLVNMKAVAIPNHEKSVASGKHYSSEANAEPRIPVRMGVGETSNGKRVFGIGIGGVLAEKALFHTAQTVAVPDELDNVTAAALPNAVIGSLLALLYRGRFQPGETVLINGATGFTGTVAVQLARLYGAGKIIATGRNTEQLKALTGLGADEVINLRDEPEKIVTQVSMLHLRQPIDIVLDYTWGQPAATLLTALQGNGAATPVVRFITVGATAGDELPLSSRVLRSAAIEVLGSGLGSLPQEAFGSFFTRLLPEVFELAAAGKLQIETITAPLAAVATAFYQETPAHKRLVFEI